MRRSICTGLFLFLYFTGLDLAAQDVQWRGPNRDGIYPDTMLLHEWPEGGPEVLFVTKGIGRGFSSAVATDKRIYVTGILDAQEYLTALDLEGGILWQKAIGPVWDLSYPETRSTPTIYNQMLLVRHGDHMIAYDIKL